MSGGLLQCRVESSSLHQLRRRYAPMRPVLVLVPARDTRSIVWIGMQRIASHSYRCACKIEVYPCNMRMVIDIVPFLFHLFIEINETFRML
jgi:hypothetical protein